MKIAIVLVTILGLAAPAYPAEGVSIIQLIANPQKYDGKKVIITGFMALDFEGMAIYLSKDSYDNSIYKNGLWCSACGSHRKLDHKYVTVEVIFDADGKGHMGLWSGQIEKVLRIWEPVKPGK